MIKIYHYNSLTKEERDRLNSSDGGWDSEPRFSRYADITNGFGGEEKVRKAVGYAWMAGEYHAVAEIDTDDLDVAYRATNHIEEDWRGNPEVAKILSGRARSSSVGDIFEKDGNFYVVAAMGFMGIPLLEEAFGINK